MERAEDIRLWLDPRYGVSRYPWAMVGGSVVAGFVAGRLAASLAGDGRRWGGNELTALLPSRRAAWSFVAELADRLQPEIHQVQELAIGALGSMARDFATRSLPSDLAPNVSSQFQDMFNRFIQKFGGRPVEGPVWGGNSSGGQEGQNLRVADIMSRDPVCCTKDTSLRDVARIMVEQSCGAVPVVDNPHNVRPVGVITDRDIVCRTLADGKDPFEMAAGDCMSPSVVTVTPDTSLADCTRLMKQHQIRRILVTDRNGRCCGIVAQADVATEAPEGQTADVVRKLSQPAGAV
jgi:CBS domain-containing protein